MSEAEFQQQVIDLARLYRWRLSHFRAAQTTKGWRTPVQGDAGFPDLVLVRDGRLIFAELKTERGKLSVAQIEWLRELVAVSEASDSAPADPPPRVRPPIEVYIWRPSDFDEIHDALRR